MLPQNTPGSVISLTRTCLWYLRADDGLQLPLGQAAARSQRAASHHGKEITLS
jgi:hypothetical protein